MSVFTEINHKGFVVYSYRMAVVNRLKNKGNRSVTLFCIAQPTDDKSVKGHTVLSGYKTEQDAINAIDSGEIYKWCKAA